MALLAWVHLKYMVEKKNQINKYSFRTNLSMYYSWINPAYVSSSIVKFKYWLSVINR